MERKLSISSESHTFANFVAAPGTVEAFKAFKAFAEGKSPPLLFCHGGIGNGKTYLLEATALRLYERGIYSRVIPMTKFLRILKEKMRQQNHIAAYDQVLDNYCQAKILLLDDVGMGMMDSRWEEAVLEELVNYRYSHRLRTAMTTNKSIADLPVRVVSRFSEENVGVVVYNTGKDYRRLATQ